MEAKRQVDMERRVQEGRDKTAARLEKLRRQRDEEEQQILFDQRLAEALQKAEMEVTEEWEKENGMKATCRVQAWVFSIPQAGV